MAVLLLKNVQSPLMLGDPINAYGTGLPGQAAHHPGRGRAPRELSAWAFSTTAVAAVATLMDALLMQRRYGLFSGGFLSSDHLSGLPAITAFLAGSLLADAAIGGVAVAFGLMLTRTLPWRVAAYRYIAVVGLALAPLVAADIIGYQLLRYLGDAVDLPLMFDLAGGSYSEVLAVAGGHLITPVITALCLMVLGVAWFRAGARRRRSGTPRIPAATWRPVAMATVVLIAGATVTTFARVRDDTLDSALRRKPSGRALGAIVNAATDVDRDGYGLLGRIADPRPFDAAVFPYAIDWPGNGVDEDGVEGDLPAGATPYVDSAPYAAWRRRPDVVLFVLESFRADVQGSRLGGAAVTPVLDALAARGVSAQRAFSPNGYTAQSRHHLFSGSVAGFDGGSTLIDDFQANGYDVAFFSAQDETFGGARYQVGFDRADTRYDARVEPGLRYSTFTTAGSLAVSATLLTDRVATFLRARRSEKPLFLYVNFHDTHFPYGHAEIAPLLDASSVAQGDIAPEREDAVRRMYINTAANVDRALGHVLALARESAGREPAVIVTADHGESLFDEGFLGHGYALNDVQTRVPLIAANLPLPIVEPFGHADLRGAINSAMSAEPDAHAAVPVIRPDPGRQVFQYLGIIDRPAQIGHVSLGGRVRYDFRTRLADVDGTGWRRTADLPAAHQLRVTALVRHWEQMMVARAERRRPNAGEATP